MNHTQSRFARSRRLVWACLWLWVTGMVRGADFDANFDLANRLFAEGKFAEAATAFDHLLESGGVSAAVYFNRGNAFFKAGQLGRAVSSYLEGQKLSPRDPDLKANLQIVRTQVQGGTPRPIDPWTRWIRALSLGEWCWLTTICVWVFFGWLALAQKRSEIGRRFRGGMLAEAMLGVFLGICALSLYVNQYSNPPAVVIAGEADIRNSPFEEAQSAFKVRDGVELAVLDRKDGWLQVFDPAQRLGWINAKQVLISDAPLKVRPKSP